MVLAAGLILSLKTGSAKPDYTRRTKKDCEFCHPPNSRKLNEAGEYYRDHRNSLKGYQPPEQSKENFKPGPSSAKAKER